MKEKITLCVFIDAFGWQILKEHPLFLSDLCPYRKPLVSVLGYSSACDPTIISGLMPEKHLHFSSYYWSPETSPFKKISYLKYLPSFLTRRGRVRRYLSKWVKYTLGISGYFQLYSLPLAYLPYFDYAEKTRIWQKGGLNSGKSIFCYLEDNKIPYYVGDQDSEEEQWEKIAHKITKEEISFGYLLLGKLDALMHAVGSKSEKIDLLLSFYENKIEKLYDLAKNHYENVELLVFSDHGMHDVKQTVDLQGKIEALELTFSKDYGVVYDSTMARFWFFNPQAKLQIQSVLENEPSGHILSEEELKYYGVDFKDKRFGEMIFLLNPGVQIVPSFMGLKKNAGMHGYEPSDESSLALIMSNRPIEEMASINEIFRLLKRSLEHHG